MLSYEVKYVDPPSARRLTSAASAFKQALIDESMNCLLRKYMKHVYAVIVRVISRWRGTPSLE